MIIFSIGLPKYLISQIRDHFLKLSRLAVPVEDRSLIQMGGTKKRKRDESQTNDDEVDFSERNLQTPIPNLHNTNKRKSSESFEDTDSKRVKFGKKNGYYGRKFNKKKWPKKKGNNNNKNDGDVTINNPQEEAQTSGEQTENQPNNTPKQKKFKNKKRNKKKNANQNHNQESYNDTGSNQETFRPFDYSSVDFNQFQGGATEANGQKFFKSKFKPKVN